MAPFTMRSVCANHKVLSICNRENCCELINFEITFNCVLAMPNNSPIDLVTLKYNRLLSKFPLIILAISNRRIPNETVNYVVLLV